MIKGIEVLRGHYQELRTKAYNNEAKKISFKDIKRYKDEANKEIERMQSSGKFQNLQEADFYKEKFTQLESKMMAAHENKISWKDFTNQIQQVLKEKSFISRSSYLHQPEPDPTLTMEKPMQSRVLQSFFDDKKSKLVSDTGFRSLLENPPISPKNFKKRIGANNDQIQRLKIENNDLRKKLESSSSPIQISHLEQQIRRQQQKIVFLETQNQRISKDNTKLRSEKSVTVYSSVPQNDDYLYSPYVINPRQNDLMKICARSSDGESIGYSNMNYGDGNTGIGSDRLSFGKNLASVGQYQDGYSDIGDYGKKQRYSIFDLSKSRFSESDSNSRLSASERAEPDEKTSVRNKISFFRPAGMIVKQPDIEIAYKRTQNNNLTANKITLFFNNKTGTTKRVNINYKYEDQYYTLTVIQKCTQVYAMQHRVQVIEVRLKGIKQDINSLIQANISVNGNEYKLWLPSLFVIFSKPKPISTFPMDTQTKNIFLTKIFSTLKDTKKIIQPMQMKQQNVGQLWGESSVYSGPIKLAWKQGNMMEITTSNKWIDLISFLLLEYR